MRRPYWAFLTVLAVTQVFISGALADQNPKDILKTIGYEQRVNEVLPLEAVFRDERGQEVRLGSFFGKKPVVLALVYYECPMLCNLVLNGVGRASRAVLLKPGKDYEIIAVSFDPKDTSEVAFQKKENVLKEYASPADAAGWHLLTGDAESIRKLTEAVGFKYSWDEEQKEFAHAGGIVVVSPEGRIFRYFMGIDFSPKDLRLSLIEASRRRIGTIIDQALLFCYHYDPATGKYGLAVMRLVRLSGILTIMAIGMYVFLSIKSEKRERAAAGNGKDGMR